MKIKMRLIKEKTNKQNRMKNRVTNLPFHFVLAKIQKNQINGRNAKRFLFRLLREEEKEKNTNVSNKILT